MSESNVEGTSDNPSESEVAAGETPTSFVFGRPECPGLWPCDFWNALTEVWSSESRECLEDAAEPVCVCVPVALSSFAPRFAGEFDMPRVEIGEIDLRRDATEDFSDGAETGGLRDLSAAAADCAARGAKAFCFVSCRLAPRAVLKVLR